MSSYPRFVPFCSSTRTLRTSTSTSSSTLSSQAHHTSQSHTTLSKSLAEHLSKPTLDLLSSKEVLELDVEMTAKFLVHEESYVSVVTCRPFESVTVCLVFLSGGDFRSILTAPRVHVRTCPGSRVFFDSTVQIPNNDLALPTRLSYLTTPVQLIHPFVTTLLLIPSLYWIIRIRGRRSREGTNANNARPSLRIREPDTRGVVKGVFWTGLESYG